MLLLLVVLLLVIVTTLGAADIGYCRDFSSSSGGPTYFCTFEVCGNATHVASTCPAVGGSFSGNTSLAIYDPSTGTQMNLTSSSVDGCYTISAPHFASLSTSCTMYTLHQSCISSECSGTAAVVNGTVSSLYSQLYAVYLLLSKTNTDVWGSWPSIVSGTFSSDDDVWYYYTSKDEGYYLNSDNNVYLLDFWPSGTSLDCDVLVNVPHLEKFIVNGGCCIYGTIPSCIGLLTDLTELGLNNNLLSGSIPVIPSVERLLLLNNSLTGTVPFLPLAEFLWVADNRLTGTIPYLPNLISLVSNSNCLSGTISAFVFMEFLVLYNNIFSGTLDAVASMESLLLLNVHNNLLSGQLVNTWPSYLLVVDISANALSGEIPSAVCDMTGLLSLKALGNSFDCYHSCNPPGYIDYLEKSTVLNPVQTQYAVCRSTTTDALCDLYDSLQVSIPKTVEYLADSQVFTTYLSDLLVSSQYAGLQGTFELNRSFDDYDNATFSRFEVVFDARSLEFIEQIQFSQMGFYSTDPSSLGIYDADNFPGVGNAPSISSNDSHVVLFGHFIAIHDSSAAVIEYTVNKYSYKLAWDCDSTSSSTSNPCKWFGKSLAFVVVCINPIQHQELLYYCHQVSNVPRILWCRQFNFRIGTWKAQSQRLLLNCRTFKV
jgi:hypothetical protein